MSHCQSIHKDNDFIVNHKEKAALKKTAFSLIYGHEKKLIYAFPALPSTLVTLCLYNAFM
jgi:hypothetical protein